jgi:hypothetical protein
MSSSRSFNAQRSTLNAQRSTPNVQRPTSNVECRVGANTPLLQYSSTPRFVASILQQHWRCLENPVAVGVFVQVVRRLGLFEPEIPICHQLFFGEIAQLKVLLAQELIALGFHYLCSLKNGISRMILPKANQTEGNEDNEVSLRIIVPPGKNFVRFVIFRPI